MVSYFTARDNEFYSIRILFAFRQVALFRKNVLQVERFILCQAPINPDIELSLIGRRSICDFLLCYANTGK